jgi:hypothetical protein
MNSYAPIIHNQDEKRAQDAAQIGRLSFSPDPLMSNNMLALRARLVSQAAQHAISAKCPVPRIFLSMPGIVMDAKRIMNWTSTGREVTLRHGKHS